MNRRGTRARWNPTRRLVKPRLNIAAGLGTASPALGRRRDSMRRRHAPMSEERETVRPPEFLLSRRRLLRGGVLGGLGLNVAGLLRAAALTPDRRSPVRSCIL